jgi:hypothetical protein
MEIDVAEHTLTWWSVLCTIAALNVLAWAWSVRAAALQCRFDRCRGSRLSPPAVAPVGRLRGGLRLAFGGAGL